jgi:23S rRNA (cytosine1962-C5)-methyltransferase
MKELVLKPSREKSLLRRHPWIFSGAIQRAPIDPAPGETVQVRGADGQLLAVAAFNAVSQISARVWDWNGRRAIDAEFFREKIAACIARRRSLRAFDPVGAERLVNGEADGLPGLVVDRYAQVLVVQASSAGATRWREAIADALLEHTGLETLYERSDQDVLQLEGLPIRTGNMRGNLSEQRVEIVENEQRFIVDIALGHKTGFYLDQRDNRALVATHCHDREVLNCFSYSGAFSVYALSAGARHVTSIDSSADALELAREHIARNALPLDRCSFEQADVFQCLRAYRDRGRQFDLIILDPPKFAPSAAHAERAARGYKDINLLAMKLLRPNGMLATFSCSSGVSRDLFRKIVAGAAIDAEMKMQVLAEMSASADHGVSLEFPEGEYLKGLLCRVAAW